MKGMYRELGGALKYPFLVPGSDQYLDMLWDWDSWLSNVALRQILLENGNEKDREQALKYEQGCVLNSLSYGGMDGKIPIWIERDAPSREEMLSVRNPWKSNLHKPTLAQHAAFLVKNMNGDAEWLRDDFYYLLAFVSKYLNSHRHSTTELIYWEIDEAIGVDNDPSTINHPYESSGSILLNALMYKELQATSYLAGCLNLPDIAKHFGREADNLLEQIREHCWDPRDGFYYSVDLNLRSVEKPDIESLQPGKLYLHVGQPRTYNCLIQRFSIWSGFMAMWANIATPQQARIMVEKHFHDTTSFNTQAGIRTLSPLKNNVFYQSKGQSVFMAGTNQRTIYKYIHPGDVRSCQLVMGMTMMDPGNIWNTMPPHTHPCRIEAYFYFDITQDNAVFHFMGERSETRHLVVRVKEVVISPSWSIYSGVGTNNYTFIWGRVGENQTFSDMDAVAINGVK